MAAFRCSVALVGTLTAALVVAGNCENDEPGLISGLPLGRHVEIVLASGRVDATVSGTLVTSDEDWLVLKAQPRLPVARRVPTSDRLFRVSRGAKEGSLSEDKIWIPQNRILFIRTGN